jgi:hypothetical protein
MDHVGLPDVGRDFDRRAGKFREPLSVVRVIPLDRPVERIAIEVLRVIHKQVLHAIDDRAIEDIGMPR